MRSYLIHLTLVVILFIACKSKSKINNESAKDLIIKSLSLPIAKYGAFKTGDYKIEGYTFKDDGNGIDPTYWVRRLNMSGELLLRDNDYRGFTAHIEKTYIGENSYGLPPYINEGPMVLNFWFTGLVKPFLDSNSNNNEATLMNLRTTNIDFGNLISLRQINENEYEVEFSLNVSNTPFGIAIKQGAWIKSGRYYDEKAFQKLKIKILRYESGWNIATDDLSSLQQRL